MRKDELEHAIRAASRIIGKDRVIIIGSQAILGTYSEDQLPASVTMSPEIDVLPADPHGPISAAETKALADQISFDVGEWSEFHQTYGFYVEGVDLETPILPPDWQYRLVGVRNDDTDNATGLCLEPHDLCAAKLMAHRDKDFPFVRVLIDAGLVDPAVLSERIASVKIEEVVSDQSLEVLEYRQRASIKWVADAAGLKGSEDGVPPDQHPRPEAQT